MRKKNAKSVNSSPKSSKTKLKEPWVDPDDAPEITNEFLTKAEYRRGDVIVKRGRPPISDKPKAQVTLRIDADALSAYRKTGAGWQSRINSDLVKAAKKLKAG
jgi:uncharacterized protein (DUF4415 family)